MGWKEKARQALCLMAALLALPGAALAGGTWYAATDEAVAGLGGYLTCDFTGDIRMTFLGDCTLGSEERLKNSRYGFAARVRENGLDYPLRGLSGLTLHDDLTVANLEVVLTDRSLAKTDKEFNFSGPTAYTEILTSAGIDCVTLANNHTHDYGDEGYEDTKAALDAAGIRWFSTDSAAVWRSNEGLMIGFLGVSYSLSGSRYERYMAQMDALKAMGCAAIITVMHAGTEYSYTPPDDHQAQIISLAIEAGTDLIIGHHPHVVQGYDIIEGVPVVYSLGNCSFGGNTQAKDPDALVVQAVLTFDEGNLDRIELHFWPITVTSDSHYNDYAPHLLTGDDARRVLAKMKSSTDMDPGEWSEEDGAVVRVE